MGILKLEPKDAKEAVLSAFKEYEHFSKVMIDAIALIDASGRVVKCNPLVSPIIGKKSKAILKAENLDELLTFSIGDEVMSVEKILSAEVPTRFDEINAKNDSGTEMLLILSTYPFLSENGDVLGAFLLMRDVTAEANLQNKYKVKSKQSITDKLTGMYNRAYFEKQVPAEVSKVYSEKPDQPGRHLSILMIDIDHFKKVNDTYGHQAGDFVLAETSKIILGNLRSSDFVCRYGGEEFIAILPSTQFVGAAKAADKIRNEIEEFVFDFEGTKIPVTASFGVSQLLVEQEEEGTGAIARADAALYQAKKTGRNRVCTDHDGKILQLCELPE